MSETARTQAEPSLETSICGVKLKNPFLVASGILGGRAGTIKRLQELGAGGVVTKTITAEERLGYPGPTVVEVSNGVLLNAMGLPNPGVAAFKKELEGLDLDIPLIISISGNGEEGFVDLARELAPYADLLELNISCPHPQPKGELKTLLGQDPEKAGDVVAAVKAAVPNPSVLVKLTPMVTSVRAVVHSCLKAGADGIALINTVPALDINLDFERPVLGNLIGGQSGPSVLPIAQRKVAEAKAELLAWEKKKKEKGNLENSVPWGLLGCGGISSGYDAAKFMLLGADAVQVGTVLKNDLEALPRMAAQLREFMKLKGYSSLEDFRGKAMPWLKGVL